MHHVEARVVKDVLPRVRTMKGYSAPRRAGWDCHGLPVELAAAIRERTAGIADAELAVSPREGRPDTDGATAYHDDGVDIWLQPAR